MSRSAPRARPRGRLAAALLASLLAALAPAAIACGVRQDAEPREVAADALPRALREASSTTSTTTPSPSSQQRTIYLVQSVNGAESLLPISQTIPDPGEPNQALRATIDRLLAYQKPEGSPYTSAIPAGTRVLGLSRDGDVINLNLSNVGAVVEGPAQRLAFAQFVYTATAEANTGGQPVTGVRFSIDGQPAPVPLDERTAEPGAVVRREDFAKLRPILPTTTTQPHPEPEPVAPEG